MRRVIPHILISGTLILISACHQPVSMPISRDKLRSQILEKVTPPPLPTNSISILSLGAKADSITDCKPAFDKAMQLCNQKNGMRLVVPAGTYFIKGPVHLVSNVCIELEKGAHLKFSDEPKDYLPVVLTSWEGTMLFNYSPFIYGYQLENVSIIGEGILDGNAEKTFSTWRSLQKDDQEQSRTMNHANVPIEHRLFGQNHYLRPPMIQLFECRNILLDGFHITNSPFWCIHLLKSENATIRNLSFNAHNVNNDGIDPEYSRNIVIENITFDNGDDNVAIKAGRDNEGRAANMPSENILIRNCQFKGLHGVVIGSEMSAGVRNVLIENNTYGGYCKRGVFLKSNPDRGGFITDIFVHNLTLGEVEDAFYITSFYHGEGNGFVTDIQRIYIDSLTCRKATHAGLVIQGFATQTVKDVFFANVTIDTAAIGLSFNHVENIQLMNVNIGGKVEDAPSAAK